MLRATRVFVSASVCIQWPTVLVSDVLLALFCQGPECVQPRAKRSPREIKQLYAAPFSAANPLLKLLPLVVVLSNSLTSFHVVAKTVLDSL